VAPDASVTGQQNFSTGETHDQGYQGNQGNQGNQGTAKLIRQAGFKWHIARHASSLGMSQL